MNPLPMLVEQLAKGAAILAIAWVVSVLLARRSAARARLIWAAAFLALLVMPLALMVPARWEYGHAGEMAPEPTPEPEPERQFDPTLPSEAAPIMAIATPAAPVATPVAKPWVWPGAVQCALALWAGGAGLLILRRMLASLRLARLERSLLPVHDTRLQTLAREILGEDAALLRLSPAATVPMAWGTWRPVIVLPVAAVEWTEAGQRAALLHEWAHVRGPDCLLRLLTTVACALHWPNPFAWLAARALRTAQEQACDDFALVRGADAEHYARQLMAAARVVRSCPAGAFAMAQPSTLGRRVRAVCDPLRDRRSAGWLARGCTLLAAGATLAAVGLAAPAEMKAALPKIEPVPRSLVEIRAQYIEVDAANLRALFPAIKAPGLLAVLPDAEADAFLGRLTKMEGGALVEGFEITDAFTPRPGKGTDLICAPRVTTKSGQRAVIEIIREVRYEVLDDGPSPYWETKNAGVTLEVAPTLTSDATFFDITPQFVELKPDALGKKITRHSFHDIRWTDPKFRLPHGQALVVGGWETVRPGRQFLVIVHASSRVTEFIAHAGQIPLPALKFDDVPLSEVAAKFSTLVQEATPAALSQATANAPRITHQRAAGLAEPRVTLELPAGALAEGLRLVAQKTRLAILAREPSTGPRRAKSAGTFIFAARPPGSLAERAARLTLTSVHKKARPLSAIAAELATQASNEDAFGFHPEVSLLTLPKEIQAKLITVEAENITLLDALNQAATAAGAELSVSEKTFHLHLPEHRPKGAQPCAEVLSAANHTARAATDAEIAGTEPLMEVHHAEVTADQLRALSFVKKAGSNYETWIERQTAIPAPKTPTDLNFAFVDAGTPILAELKAAGVAIVSPPVNKTPERKETTIRVFEQVRAENPEKSKDAAEAFRRAANAGATEYLDVTVEPTLGPDGTIDLNLVPQFGQQRDGEKIFATRRVQTNVTIFLGSSVVLMQRSFLTPGKISMLFLTPKAQPAGGR